MNTSTVTARAAQLTAKFLAAQADYLEECREYGEQGYRHPECFHGTNQWTDYDNICAGCEDDDTINQWSTREEVEAYALALAQGEALHAEAEARRQAERERELVANGTGMYCELLERGGWTRYPLVRLVDFSTDCRTVTVEIVKNERIKQLDMHINTFRMVKPQG